MAATVEGNSVSSGFNRFSLPGWTLPLNFEPIPHHQDQSLRGEGKQLFESLLTGDGALPLLTLREMTMLQLIDQLSDKPNWHKKIFDEEITAKWKSEALSGVDVTEKMVDWCIAELRYTAEACIFKKTGAISVLPGQVVKSDTAVPLTLKDELQKAVKILEDVSDAEKDWHPNSNEMVLDLVHPSLFPLVYGRSRILEDSLTTLEDCIDLSGAAEVIPVPKLPEDVSHWELDRLNAYSKQFQWLPSEVDIQGENCKITSYINNLHPQHYKDLYSTVEKIIDITIPIWNMTLTPCKTSAAEYRRIPYTKVLYPEDDNFPDDPSEISAGVGPQREEGEQDWQFENRFWEWHEEKTTERLIVPDAEEFVPPYIVGENHPNPLPDGWEVDLRKDYGQRGLQVIVKLANIHLTPEQPEYKGGSWHIEGQRNEHICATAIYYYDSENITTTRLSFRQMVESSIYEEVSYKQGDTAWLSKIFGCQNEGPGIQELPSVEAKEGRLLTFPNVLQHCVQPFKLADPTKPGHRKILAIFLIDPNIRIISTANIPVQRQGWWDEKRIAVNQALARLPRELQDMIVRQPKDFPLRMEEAKELRLRLMAERTSYVQYQTDQLLGNTFNLCEH